MTTIGDTFIWTKGRKPHQLFDEVAEERMPYLSASYFRTGRPDQFASLKDKNVVTAEADDVVLIWDGSNAGDVFRGLHGALSSTMVKFNKNSLCDSSFLYFLLKNNFRTLNKATTGSTIPHVSGTVLKEIEIPTSNNSEQKAIARVLTTVQDAIAEQERLIEKLKELKRSMMHRLFTHGTKGDKTKMTEIGEIPKSWDVVKLGDCSLDIGDGNYSTKYPRQSEFIETGVPFIRANNFDDGQIIWDDMRYISPLLHKQITKGHLKAGDVLIVTRGNIGRTAIVTEEFVGANINAQIVRINGGEQFDQKYFFYLLNYGPIYNQMVGLKTGTALQQLPIGKLAFVQLLKAPREEQRLIGGHISVLDEKITTTRKKVLIYQSLFKTLLHELMSGERRIIK